MSDAPIGVQPSMTTRGRRSVDGALFIQAANSLVKLDAASGGMAGMDINSLLGGM